MEVFTQWRVNLEGLDQPVARRGILLLVLFSWTLFPILFLIGPETFNLMNQQTSMILHACGDLIAKNFFSFCCWKVSLISVRMKEEVTKQAIMEKELQAIARYLYF